MNRLTAPSPADFNAAQKEVHDAIANGPRGSVRGPLGVWLWQPELARQAQALGQYCRFDSSLSASQSELAILLTARHWSSEFEWQHHVPFALEAGIEAELIEIIRTRQGHEPIDDTQLIPEQQAIIRFTSDLLATKKVTRTNYEFAVTTLGEKAVVDLVGVLGYYSLISMTINVFEVEAPGPDVLT